MVVDVQVEPAVRIGPPRRLFATDRFDWPTPVPGGGFVALMHSDTEETEAFEVWLGWSATVE